MKNITGDLGFLGIGISPYHIGRAPISMHGAVYMGDNIVTGVSRYYLTLFHVPIIPLPRLFAEVGIETTSEYAYIPLDRNQGRRLVDNCSSYTSWCSQPTMASIRGSWILSLILALIGGGIGSILLSQFPLSLLVGACLGLIFLFTLYKNLRMKFSRIVGRTYDLGSQAKVFNLLNTILGWIVVMAMLLHFHLSIVFGALIGIAFFNILLVMRLRSDDH